MHLEGYAVAWAAAGVLTAGIATAIWIFGGGRPVTRLFAVALALGAVLEMQAAVSLFDRDFLGKDPAYWQRFGTLVTFSYIALLLSFGVLWPTPVRHASRWLVGVAAYAVILTAGYLLDPGSVFDPAARKFGPLAILFGWGFLALTVPAMRWMRLAAPPDTLSYLLLAFATATYALVYAFNSILFLVLDPAGAIAMYGVWVEVTFIGGSVLALGAYAWMTARLIRRPDTRKAGIRFAAALSALLLLNLALEALETVGVPVLGFQSVGILVDVASALAIGYAVLRLRLFDLDVKVKWTISRSTVAAAFLAVFFVVAQVAQEFLTDAYGWALGGVAAGALVFALGPLQRVAARVADAALPGVADTPEWRDARRADVYRSAVRLAWSDGRVSTEDEDLLASLAEELALPPTRALALRREVETALHLTG